MPAIGDALGDSFESQEEKEVMWKDEPENLLTNKKAFMGRTHEVSHYIGGISLKSPAKGVARFTAGLLEDEFDDEAHHFKEKIIKETDE